MLDLPPYGFEPSLAEALDDPIIQQMMRSDGVSRDDVMHLVDHARHAADALQWPHRRTDDALLH